MKTVAEPTMTVYTVTAENGNDYAINNCNSLEEAARRLSGEIVKHSVAVIPYARGAQYAAIANVLQEKTGVQWFIAPARFADHADCAFIFQRDSDGLAFWAVADRYGAKGKYEFFYDTPRTAAGKTVSTYEKTVPKIKISIDKTPEKIAGDLIRRLIPAIEEAAPAWIEAVERANEYDRKEAAVKKAMDMLRYHSGEVLHFDANGGSVKVSGYVTIEQAVKLYEFAKTLEA